MGKRAKSSRKGKKEWRANISTEDIEEYYDKSTKDALSGGSLANAPSDSLFYVDKSIDLAVKRKIEKRREKVLHCDSVLQRNTFVQPIPSSQDKYNHKKGKKEIQPVNDEKVKALSKDSGIIDMWGDGEKPKVKPRKMTHKPSIIPAVEVEPNGCSFNPTPESHQDSLAIAVADEMQKIYRKELAPRPIPLTVPGEAIDEENMYFLDADDESDDDNDEKNEDVDSEKRPIKKKVITRVELNRRARRKVRTKAEAEAQKKEGLSREIDSVEDIIKEIAKDDEERENKRVRLSVVKEEKRKTHPPRLGKYTFDPPAQQVLLSEEITGSLRKLKGCCTLARDRFKSLEKRGLVVPSKRTGRK